MPEWATTDRDKDASRLTTTEQRIPLQDVRLVMRRSDPDTGAESDVIIRHIHAGPPYIQRDHGSNLPSHTRYVSGLEEVLPWPESSEEIQEFKREDIDTPRMWVERVTYSPSIIHSPLDSEQNTVNNRLRQRVRKGIMDELRSKTRVDNTRHDDAELVRRKIMEDARAIWWRDRQFLLPKNEKAQKDIEQRKTAFRTHTGDVAGPGQVSTDTLELIKQAQASSMAKQRQRQRNML